MMPKKSMEVGRSVVSGWIRVEDRMPEDGQQILFFANMNPWVGWLHSRGGFHYFDGLEAWGVRHWQPMPEPPAEVGK